MGKVSALKRLSDEELAVKAQAGSHPYFEELVERYSSRLFHFLQARVGSPQDTEDLVQETFLKTYRNIGRFDSTYKFSTWIYTTAQRLAVSYFRKKRESEIVFDVPSAAAGPHEKMVLEENYRNLWQAARALGQDQYQALWLRYMEDMPLPDIARVMKKSRIHVRVLLHRARLHLVKALNQPVTTGETTPLIPAERNLSFL
jgi:RNA polymerase sigma-70 factor (ECF subfamily)